MKSKLLSVLLALFLGAAAPAMAQVESAPSIHTYQSTPFWLDGQTIPHVMLVLERDWKMFYPAYNNLADLDGDGALDIGFNPKVTYVGYFDHTSCYRYINSDPSDKSRGRFVRLGPTTPQSEGEAASLAPSEIKDNTNLAYPASAHGVCERGAATVRGDGQWHGNWLNYAMTSRMDAMRKVLYGGKRQVDDLGRTILTMIFIPGNAHVWGGELYADDLWNEYAPSSPWYDIPSFTGYTRPLPRTMHFWARASLYWSNPFATNNATPQPADHYTIVESAEPLFRFVANIPSTNLHPMLKTPIRIWDWVGDHTSYGSMPIDGNLAKSRRQNGQDNNNSSGFMYSTSAVARNFMARVEVCQEGNISDTEGCRAYGKNYKPIGLLQQYGESERMFFGLLTGSIQYDQRDSYHGNKEGGPRYRGGVVRHHVQPFNNYINMSTGQIKTKTPTSSERVGIIPTIDGLEITGLGKHSSWYDFKVYVNGSQAGNPLGEMVWEATRYLVGSGKRPEATGGTYTGGGGLNPTTQYNPTSETQVRDHNGSLFSLPKLTSWGGRPALGANAQDCPKPIILVISEVFPDHDGDDYYNLNSLSSAPLISSAAGSAVPQALDIDRYLDLITAQEKLTTSASGQQFFFPSPRGLCMADNLTGGLKNIIGHCPSEPSLEGTYNIAAIAYYAHTHNFAPLMNDKDMELNVDLYAVGIAGNFPDITLTVDNDRSVTLMPLTLASLLGSSSYIEQKADNEFKTLLNFFIEYWQTDDGHTYQTTNYAGNTVTRTRKVPFKVKFSTNFEFTTTPCYTYGGNSNNWERDLFNTFTISLLTTEDTHIDYREEVPLFINSGPYKTNLARWNNDKARYNSTGNASASFTSQTYYYAFKRPPKGKTFDIANGGFNVAGVAIHSDTFGSGYGSSGLTGYTITGVTYPGAYVDTGLYRADYPLFYTTKSSFYPGSITVDEPLPLDPAGSGIPGARWNWAGGVMHSGAHYTSNGSDCGYYHPPTLQDELLTPAECPYYGYNNETFTDPDLAAAYNPKPNALNVCGMRAAGEPYDRYTYPYYSNTYEKNAFGSSLMRYVQVRSFKFNISNLTKDKPAKLPNPLWLAAKYGGFRDSDSNGLPDRYNEWIRGGEGVGAEDPYNYFGVANMSELPKQLGSAFEAIANSVGTGTANASSVSMVLGGGISIQTQYRVDYQEGANKITWGGSTYALFMDKWGNLRADTSVHSGKVGNQELELATLPPSSRWEEINPGKPRPSPYEQIGDKIVHVVGQVGPGMPNVYLCDDYYGDNNGGNYLPSDPGQFPPSGDGYIYPPDANCGDPINNGLDSVAPLWNAAQQVSDMNPDDRKLYTFWDDTPSSDGKNAWTSGGGGISLDSTREFKAASFDRLKRLMNLSDDGKLKDLINFIRGVDLPNYRQRTARLPWDPPSAPAKVWRMGDVINSMPVMVGVPDSSYNIIYEDQSYGDFRDGLRVEPRRQVAYFGSNDGILHAVNVGFFGDVSSGQAGYFTQPPDGRSGFTPHELGAEIWGYLPPAVLPHLQWLANDDYQHSYYVDLKPHIVDAKNGSDWRTVMIVGLRLGGAPIELTEGGPGAYSLPEFFALDVTDPEEPPKLLWRFSDPSLGQSTASPAVVRSGHDGRFYVILPSGPAQVNDAGQPIFNEASELYAGRSSRSQKARVIVLDLFTGQLARARDRDPSSAVGPDPLMVEENRSFFNNSFTPRALDYTLDASGVSTWGHHAVYLGLSSVNGSNYDSGAVYRVQMVDAATGSPLTPDNWKLTRFYNTDKPVTGAVNSTYDRNGNLWVIFGTGRIWSKDDMTPCGVNIPADDPDCPGQYDQYLFGIKEPLLNGRMTFEEVPITADLIDVSGVRVYENGDLEPASVNGQSTYDRLLNSMIDPAAGVPGYKLKLETWRKDRSNYKNGTWTNPHPTVYEMINTQVKLDDRPNKTVNAVVSTYIPSNNICDPLGESWLFLFDAFTGLPAPQLATFGTGVEGGTITVNAPGSSGPQTYQEMTSLKKVGVGMASEAWVLKTDDGVMYGATAFAGHRVVFRETGPMSARNALISWREVLDMNFDLENRGNLLYNDLL